MVYIKCILFLKFSTLATMLLVRDNSVKTGLISSSYSHTTPETIEQLSDGDRIEFQIRNHQGPGTYIFGFDTGHGRSRQYRIEERFSDGSVKGRYGFYDAKGKLRIIDYNAGPTSGYQERHHETISSMFGT